MTQAQTAGRRGDPAVAFSSPAINSDPFVSPLMSVFIHSAIFVWVYLSAVAGTAHE
jgi:hypothetical protein